MRERKLSNFLDGYLEYQDDTEPPIIYQKWVGISLIAAALQRKVRLPWGRYSFYPNMYIILVGPPGKARKGTAMRPAKELLADLDIKITAEATTREALIRRLGESISTYTPEGGLPQSHCSMTVFSDELTVFLGYNNKELMAHLADWFDCANSWTYDTKNVGTDIVENLWVNLIGATTPELIQATMPLDMIGGGLASRMIFVYAAKKGKKVIPIYTDALKSLRADIKHDLEMIHTLNGDFQMTSKAFELYSEWYMNKPEDSDINSRHFAYYWERREVHLLKLCMIMSAARSNELIIRPKDYEKADAFLTHAEQFMPQAFSGIGKLAHGDLIGSIIGFIASAGETTTKALINEYIYDITPDQLTEILETLKLKGFLKISNDDIPGRPKIITYIPEEEA